MLPNKKLIITISLLSVVVFIATTAMQSQQQQQEVYKNLKVLPKNISHDDMEKVMHEWATALGQRCGFCHARNSETNKTDFASDAKPEKEMARSMMKMTAKINKKYFKMDKDKTEHSDDMMAAITCMTCHHGSPHPDSKSAMNNSGPNNMNRAAPSQPGTPGASQPPAKL